jgi:hypothetical protein
LIDIAGDTAASSFIFPWTFKMSPKSQKLREVKPVH